MRQSAPFISRRTDHHCRPSQIGVSEAVILGAVRQSMLVEKIDNGMTRLVSWWPLPHVRGPLSRGLKPRVRPAMVANGSPLALEIRI